MQIINRNSKHCTCFCILYFYSAFSLGGMLPFYFKVVLVVCCEAVYENPETFRLSEFQSKLSMGQYSTNPDNLVFSVQWSPSTHVQFTDIFSFKIIWLLKNISVPATDELLPSRFDDVPPAFKSFSNKKKTKKSKKLPTYCVFCKVSWILEVAFIISQFYSHVTLVTLLK